MFHRNCGTVDRLVRLVMGLIFLPVGLFLLDGSTGLFVIGISLLWLVTGASGFCIFYLPFRISTIPKSQREQKKEAAL